MRRAPGSRYVLGPARRPYHCCALLRTSVEPASTATVAPSPSPSSSSPPPSLRPFFPSKTRHGYHPTADRLVARLATSAVTEVAEGTTSYAALLPHFISLFRAVLQLERSIPPNMPRGLLAAAAAIAVELSPVAVGATLVGRLPTTAAHLQSVGRLQQLSQAFAALVRQAAADSAQRPAATSLRWPRQLGEELTQASFATRAQTAHCHNPHVVGMPRGGVEATWTSVVESVAVQLFLSFRFLRATPPSTSTVAETHFVHVMLDAICSRTYTFHEVGADGKLREFRVDGVAGLLEHVLRPEHQLFAQDLGNQRGRTQRRMECVALSTLMRLFFVMLPELQQASAVGLRQRSLAGGDAASIDVDGTNDIATRRVVGVIRRRWKESAPAVQLAGAAEALPWLEMAPILLDGFRGLVEYQMKEHPHHEEEDDVAARIIAAVLPDLAACLNDFLQYDVARHMSVDGPSTDSTPTSLATTTTSSPPSGGPEGLQRNRGKRSLFYHDATATPVLRNDHVSGTDAATSTSRFTTRGTTTTADAGSSMSRGRRGGHAGVKGGELGDTLFHVFVCSDSCTAMLTAQYSLLATRRESLLEDVWLQGVCALRRTREALFSPDTPLVESPPNMAVPSGTRQPRDVKAELLDDALPALLRTAGRTTDRQKRLDQLRLLAHAQALLPTEVLECLQHILHALVQPLGAIWACPDAVRGTELRHKRAVGHVLWMGAQELILHNPAPRHAIESTWRLWLTGGVSSGRGELGRFSQVADDLVLTGMHMQQSGSEELTLATNQALRDLREGLVLGSFGCFAKQVMAARALRGIYALGNVARRGGGGPTAPGELAAGTACYRELLGLLASDVELLLLCAYPAFLDMLYESYIRLGIPRVEILAFGDERLLPVLVPVMAAALAKSRAEDHARAHIQLCETTLFLLSQLSRFASAPDISLSRVLQTSSSDALMQVSFYCLRRAGRGGLRRMDELGWPEATLPNLPLPANITSEALLMGLVASSSSYPDTQSMNFLHVLDRSNAIMSSPRVQPLFRGQVEVVVRALLAYVESAGDRQRRHLYRAVVLSTTARESTAVRPVSAMLHVDARELRVALLQRHEVERAYETHLAPSRVAGAKDFPFVADGSLSAYLLGFLIRFMEHYLRMRERVHRASMQQLSAPAKPSGKKLTVDGTTESLTSLILLDVLSYLGQGGGWAMVCWTLNVAETATRLGRLRHGRLGDTSLESLQRSTALTAILAQLRAVPPPSPSSLLPSSFLKAVNILADVVATSPRTLLQFDRRSPLVDLLREPSRDRYRVLIFGIKQVVLYVQEASMHHQSATQTSAVDDGAASSEDVPSSSLVIPVYFREADDAVAHEAHCKARRYFLCSVLAAVDLCAEAIRSHALQHHSMDDELRHLLALSLRSLMHTLGAVVLTHLRFVTPTTMPKTAAEGVVEREAELLWVALCVSSTIGAVAAMDHAGVFFCGPTLHDVQQLMTTLAALLSQATGRPAALPRLPFSRRLLVAATVLSGDAHTAFRQALRLALDPRDGMDLTSVYRAIHAFGDAAGGCPSVAPLLRQLFAALAQEMEEVRHNTSPPTTTTTTKGKRGRKSKTVAAEALDAGDALIVGSLPRFEAALTAVVDLHRRLSPDAGTAMTTAEVVSGVVMEKIVCEGVIAASRQAEGDATGSSMSMEEENDAWGRSSSEDGLTDTSALALMTLSEWCVSAGDDGGASAFYLLAQQAPLFTRSAVSGGGSGPAGWSATFTDAHLRVYVANVVALLEGHKLVEVVRHAQGIFLTVEYLLERTTRLAASVMMTSEGSSTSSTSRDDAELLALLRKLWLTIATKWEEELIQSAEPTFLAAQQELLYAVRQQRSQMEPEEIEAGQDWWLSTTPAAPLATELFGELRSGVVTSLAARARGAIAAPEHVDLRAHDDLTTAVSSPIGNAHFFRAASDLLHPPKTQPAIPLALLLRLLQAFSHGSGRGEEELQRLAAAISTYAARQYVLLRPRQRGSCLNVVGLLLPEIMEDGDGMLGATGVLRAVGVPSTSAWVGPAEGIFFSDGQRAALVAQFKEAVPSIHDWSAEAWSLAYLRCGAVFLHLLSVLLRVLDHYQLGSAEMAELSIANVRREVRQRRGTTNGPADSEDASRQVELAVLREVRRRCTERQLDPVKVNTNLHESVVLQWLNATTILTAHTDALTHHAVDRAVSLSTHKAADSTSAATTCLSFLDELRSITANALEATMQVMQGYNARGWESCYARAVHLCVGRCPMEPLPLHLAEHRLSKGGAAAERYVSALRHRQVQRPELFVGSPTLLSVLTPSFYVRHFSVMVERSPSAASASVAAVVACLHFHMTQPHVPLGSVLAAVTELLASTSVRPTPVKMLCESLAMELLRRQDFRAALDPPTVASADHTTSASVPNEVLVPFLAAISREDVTITRKTLAALLHAVMRARADIFGQPPTANRQDKLSLAAATTQHNNAMDALSLDRSNPLYLSSPVTPSPMMTPPALGSSSSTETGCAPPHLDGALTAFTADPSDAAAATHRHALAGLSLSLPAAMEVAMHLAALRSPTREEFERATSMLRAADNDRRERATVYRSKVTSAIQQRIMTTEREKKQAMSAAPLFDAALHLEDPNDYGVALLHLRYALRKIVHSSFRRLARHAQAVTLADMVEMLHEVDPGFRKRAEGNHGSGGAATPPTTRRPSAAAVAPRHLPRDIMLAGTLRVLLARATLCARGIGYSPSGDPLPGGLLEPLLRPPHSEAEGRVQRSEAEAAVTIANSTSSLPYASRQRVRRALTRTIRYRIERQRQSPAGRRRPGQSGWDLATKASRRRPRPIAVK